MGQSPVQTVPGCPVQIRAHHHIDVHTDINILVILHCFLEVIGSIGISAQINEHYPLFSQQFDIHGGEEAILQRQIFSALLTHNQMVAL